MSPSSAILIDAYKPIFRTKWLYFGPRFSNKISSIWGSYSGHAFVFEDVCGLFSFISSSYLPALVHLLHSSSVAGLPLFNSWLKICLPAAGSCLPSICFCLAFDVGRFYGRCCCSCWWWWTAYTWGHSWLVDRSWWWNMHGWGIFKGVKDGIERAGDGKADTETSWLVMDVFCFFRLYCLSIPRYFWRNSSDKSLNFLLRDSNIFLLASAIQEGVEEDWSKKSYIITTLLNLILHTSKWV